VANVDRVLVGVWITRYVSREIGFWLARVAWYASEVAVLRGELPTTGLGPLCGC
jgi:hypothetical protein